MTLPSIESVVIIGSGNVATHLAGAIKKTGKKIIQIYSKHLNSAKQLSHETGASYAMSIKEISKEADLYILAISDNAIEEVAASLNIDDKIIVHTSGTVSADVLKNASSNYGVIYPLQTFSKSIPVDWKVIPVFIEANNKGNEDTLINFIKNITGNVVVMTSEKRKILHLSAVFVNNFVNYMYTIAEDIMQDQQIPFDYLKPLILETASRVLKNNPRNIQTGPAARGDRETIQKHLDLLSKQEEYAEIYGFLTNMIIKKYENKEKLTEDG